MTERRPHGVKIPNLGPTQAEAQIPAPQFTMRASSTPDDIARTLAQAMPRNSPQAFLDPIVGLLPADANEQLVPSSGTLAVLRPLGLEPSDPTMPPVPPWPRPPFFIKPQIESWVKWAKGCKLPRWVLFWLDSLLALAKRKGWRLFVDELLQYFLEMLKMSLRLKLGDAADEARRGGNFSAMGVSQTKYEMIAGTFDEELPELMAAAMGWAVSSSAITVPELLYWLNELVACRTDWDRLMRYLDQLLKVAFDDGEHSDEQYIMNLLFDDIGTRMTAVTAAVESGRPK